MAKFASWTRRSLRRASLRLRRMRSALPKFFAAPVRSILENYRLIRSMARRDILARYRGSFGDVFWTILNPLLLMATYFFVFGVVLRSRFGADRSSTGFALYFLAGMLPWLAFSEPAGRAPHVVLEHRNFVKKLIFPLETLPVNQVVAGLVTELFAAAVFLTALLIIRGTRPGLACCGCPCCWSRNCCSHWGSAGSWQAWASLCATWARSWASC